MELSSALNIADNVCGCNDVQRALKALAAEVRRAQNLLTESPPAQPTANHQGLTVHRLQSVFNERDAAA